MNYLSNFRTLLIKSSTLLLVSVALLACTGKTSKKAEQEKQQLIIFHAGSLAVPFKEVIVEFNKEYPNIEVITEAAGSVQCARKVTDLNKECDIIASADYTVIENMLIPNFADWNINFTTNEMAIVYHDASRYANEINKDNWYKILLKKDVAYGRSDPNSDPCGYRAVLTSQLAESYYQQKGLAEQLMAKDQNYIRPKETDMLGLLESNAIDYIFLYRSVAQQHNLKYVVLSDSISLNNPRLSDFYKTASVEIAGKTPGEKTTKIGEPMVYGITILKNAPNKEAAVNFVKFLLEKDKGMAIMERNGQPSIVPASTTSYDKLPVELATYATK